MNLRKLNVAEWFSFSRILTFPIVVLLIWIGEREITAWFYVIMFSTDFLDGFFAYFFNMEGKRRAQLDTLGDIFYILAGMYGFYVFEKEFFLSYFSWIAIVAILYLIQLVFCIIRFGQPCLFHTYLAKIATACQVVFLCYMFFYSANETIFYVAVVASILELIEEIIMIIKIKEWKENVKGIWDIK